MYKGGIIDVKKYSGVCTGGLSGCQALLVAEVEKSAVVDCFFTHQLAGHIVKDDIITFVADNMNNFKKCYAILIDNYSNAYEDKILPELKKKGMPYGKMRVYINKYKSGGQTFGMYFPKGIYGELLKENFTKSKDKFKKSWKKKEEGIRLKPKWEPKSGFSDVKIRFDLLDSAIFSEYERNWDNPSYYKDMLKIDPWRKLSPEKREKKIIEAGLFKKYRKAMYKLAVTESFQEEKWFFKLFSKIFTK